MRKCGNSARSRSACQGKFAGNVRKGVAAVRVKKSGNMIFGADLTAAERKAAEIEIKKQIGE